jgi:chromosome segregation ATPase
MFALRERKPHAAERRVLGTSHVIYPSKGRRTKAHPSLEGYYSKYLPPLTQQSDPFNYPPSVLEANTQSVVESRERELEWSSKGLGSASNPQEYSKKKLDSILKAMGGHIRGALGQLEGEGLSSGPTASQDTPTTGHFDNLKKYRTEEEGGEGAVAMSEEEVEQRRKDEVAQLEGSIAKGQDRVGRLDEVLGSVLSNIKQIEALIAEEEGLTSPLEQEYRVKKRVMGLLGNAEENILQLQEIATTQQGRLTELAQEWEQYRMKLVEEHRALKHRLAHLSDDSQKKLDAIRAIRAQMKVLGEEVRAKDEKYRELSEAYSQLQRDITRSYYTDRILDIVRTVKKQKAEIERLVDDTMSVQKEIRSTSDTLNRSFSVIDEMIYQDATTKQNPTAKEAYKQVVGMNEQFKRLVKLVEEMGHTKNSILTLEQKIETVSLYHYHYT